MPESEASAQITGISGGFIGTLRAYTICLLCVGQRLDGAAVHFIVLPQREAWQ